MRVCPKCGYEDNYLWENCRFKRDLQLMRIEDFIKQFPHLSERIKKERYVRDGQFLYHKTSLYVLRKEPADWNQPFAENFERKGREMVCMANYHAEKRRAMKTQTRLLEVNK